MSETLKGHFGGEVISMDTRAATVCIDKVHPAGAFGSLGKGSLVEVSRENFMNQMPMPSEGSYVEGNIEPQGDEYRFTNIVRPV